MNRKEETGAVVAAIMLFGLMVFFGGMWVLWVVGL